MTRKYKTSYKSPRPVKRFTVTFDAPAIAANIQEACTICHGKIEESPMMRGVCYNCYRDLIAAEQHKALQIVLDVASAGKPDTRITRRESILAAFRDEPLSKVEASELYKELAEIDQALQFHPSDTLNDYIGASWEKMEEIKF